MPYDIGGAANMGGGGFDWSNLLQNKMFLSFLSKAGATLNPEMQPLDQLTQQAIGAQSKAGLIDRYNKILSGMLKGEIPTGGKLTLDKDGMKANVPSSALSGPFNEGGGGGQDRGLGGMKSSGTNWDDPANRTDLIGKVRAASPFDSSQLGVSGADLAGLTSQDVSQALKDAIGTASLKEQTINDIAERVYKSQLGKWYEAQTAAVGAPGPLDKPFIGSYTLRQFNALPSKDQEYIIYATNERNQGRDPKSRRDFEMMSPTTRENFLRSAMKDPKLMEAAEKLAIAGAPRTEVLAERRETLGKVDQELEITSPEYIDNTMGKIKKNHRSYTETLKPYVKRWREKGVSRAEADRLGEKAYTIDVITDRLEAFYGKDRVKVEMTKGGDIVWTVNGRELKRLPK